MWQQISTVKYFTFDFGWTDNILNEFQAGFRKNYSTIDNIFNFTNIIEINKAVLSFGVNVAGDNVKVQLNADDIVVLADSPEDLQAMIDRLGPFL